MDDQAYLKTVAGTGPRVKRPTAAFGLSGWINGLEGVFAAVPACVNRTHPLSDETLGGVVRKTASFSLRACKANFRIRTMTTIHEYGNHESPVSFEFEVRDRRRGMDALHFCKELPRK